MSKIDKLCLAAFCVTQTMIMIVVARSDLDVINVGALALMTVVSVCYSIGRWVNLTSAATPADDELEWVSQETANLHTRVGLEHMNKPIAGEPTECYRVTRRVDKVEFRIAWKLNDGEVGYYAGQYDPRDARRIGRALVEAAGRAATTARVTS